MSFQRLCRCACACFLGLSAATVWSQNWTAVKLNDSAVTNAAGAIVVLGTDIAVWTPGMTKEAVYDGDFNTFFDPQSSSGAWAGYQLRSPKCVTRIRYCGRTSLEYRMVGARFEGANTADFSDAVTLWTHTPPSNWTGDTWIDVTVTNAAALQAFTYLRFYATGETAGAVREVEFYGVDAASTAPSTPAPNFADSANWYTHLRWVSDGTAMVYEVQRKTAQDSDFTTVQSNWYLTSGTSVTWRDPQTLFSDTQYRIRARNAAGNSDWFTFTATARNAATGTLMGVSGSYMNNGMTFDKNMDANIDTFFDGPESSGGNNLWSGIDLGAPRRLVGVRFVPRSVPLNTWASRMTGGQFQVANDADFTAPVTVYTISSDPAYTNMTAAPVTLSSDYRYVRYLSPDGGWGNASEVEFDLAPSAPKAPTGLSVVRSGDLTNDWPVLSWAFAAKNLISSSVVYRATAPGGPYANCTPAGLAGTTWTDTNLLVGVIYYCKVATLYMDGTTALESAKSGYVTYRRSERLERDWSNLTALKPGMTAFYDATEIWYSADRLFDGDFSTFGDAGPSNSKVGVDLGVRCGISWIRFSPRYTWINRVNGAVVQGANSSAYSPATTLATLSGSVYGALTTLYVTDTNTYRYVFATRLDGNEFYSNLCELELYGWRTDSLTNVMTAPLSVSFAPQTSALTVSWTPGTNLSSYRVERMPADGSGSWAAVGTTTDLTLSDPSPVLGVRYLYRVASLRTLESGEEVAYSDSYPVVAFVPGAGTGLKGYYHSGYSKAYAPGEKLEKTQVDPTVDFTWSSGATLISGVASSTTNVLITWYGKVIVPYDGTYTFYTTTDDGAALRIDGQFVIDRWIGQTATTYSAALALTAGEHSIRFDYYQDVGDASAKLEWDGLGYRAVIPSSQLVPVDLPSDSFDGWQGRSFNAPKLGYHLYDAGTGSLTLYSCGMDISGDSEGHHFVWQTIKGPFLLEAKLNQNVDPLSTNAKALLMVRNGIESGRAFLAPARMATGQLGYKARLADGATVTDLLLWQGAPSNPCWMRLKRSGNTFTTFVRDGDGDAWLPFHTFVDTNNVFGATMYAGFSVTAPQESSASLLQSATFTHFRLARLFGTLITIK